MSAEDLQAWLNRIRLDTIALIDQAVELGNAVEAKPDTAQTLDASPSP